VRSGPVLQVITDNDRRGGQVFASDLHTALERRGVPVRTVALGPATSSVSLGFEALGPSRRHPRTIRALRAAMGDSSIVVGHGSTTLPACAASGVGRRVPFVYRQISEQLFWANTPVRRARTRLALGRADHVTALWRGAAEVLVERFGVASRDVTVVPNGVPSARCPGLRPADRLEARRAFGLDPQRPTLLSIGALVPEKGVDTLIEAMSEPALDGWQLLVVGVGPELPRLRKVASELPTSTVTFHEPVATARDAFAAADVVGLTSRGGDSMPAVLIEAGMLGLPVVATPVEGIVDIVLDGRTGRLVTVDEPRETALAVAETAARADELGAAARGHCLTNFEIGPVAERWQEVLERVSGLSLGRTSGR
jgi:glycosyltransferase involved in cell wall biosynthesis